MKQKVKSPLVTIVTPVFNGEKYIRDTIESVLSQTYTNIEYIIVDGGSTDKTLSIVSDYKDKITHMVSEPDNGMYDALNKGFKISSGEIFCYLNSDDIYFPDTVEKVVSKFESFEVSFCFGDFVYIDGKNSLLSKFYGVDLNYKNAINLYRIPFAQQTAFWRKEVHEAIGGFDVNYKYVADTKFFFKVLKLVGENKFYIHEFLAKFRTHEDAFSVKVRIQMHSEHESIMNEMGAKRTYKTIFLELYVKLKNIRNIANRIRNGKI